MPQPRSCRRASSRERARRSSRRTRSSRSALIKLATVSSALAETLRERGVEEPTASLTAELAVAVFRIAFERWVADGNERDLQELISDSLDELTALAA